MDSAGSDGADGARSIAKIPSLVEAPDARPPTPCPSRCVCCLVAPHWSLTAARLAHTRPDGSVSIVCVSSAALAPDVPGKSMIELGIGNAYTNLLCTRTDFFDDFEHYTTDWSLKIIIRDKVITKFFIIFFYTK